MKNQRIRIELTLEEYGILANWIGIAEQALYHDRQEDKAKACIGFFTNVIQGNAECIDILPNLTLTSGSIKTVAVKPKNEIEIPEKAHTDVINFKSKATNAFGSGEKILETLSFIDQIKQKQKVTKADKEPNGGVAPAFIAPEKNEEHITEKKALYLTTKDVAAMLDVDVASVAYWRNPKSRISIPFKYINGRPMYKESDITTFQRYYNSQAKDEAANDAN